MLINIRISELQSNTSNSILLAIAIAISFNYPVFQLLPYNITIINNHYNLNHILQNISLMLRSLANNKNINLNLYNDDIYFVTSKIWDGNLIESSHITSIGNILYTNYNIWLILASFILLLAMVGSIVITIKPNTTNS